MKECGVNAVCGDQRARLNMLLDKLKGIGIYVVPCGEVEHFVPDVGGHGASWLSNVIQHHPNLDDAVYCEARSFVRSWCLWQLDM